MVSVSVIIPVYNAETYLSSCVDSVLRQTLDKVEVIIVNDGSTDGSMALCREKYGANPNVRLIDMERNMGPAAARNRGMREASGEYIAFVDSDDAVLEDELKHMYIAAKLTDADVLHATGAIYPLEDSPSDHLADLPDEKLVRVKSDVMSGIDSLTVLDDDLDHRLNDWIGFHYRWNVWNKLFRRSFE